MTDRLIIFTEQVRLFCLELSEKINEFWTSIPFGIRAAILIFVFVAYANVIASIVKAAIKHKKTWKKAPYSDLMLSFSAGSGQYQRKSIFKDARKYLLDRKWSWFSFAGLAYRFGSYTNNSRVLLFFCSFAYLTLAVFGIVEMILRFVLGLISYVVFNLVYMIVLFLAGIINYILIPLFSIPDKLSLVTQHCPECYNSFKLPVFECPKCKTKHSNLIPGKTGLLFARCKCGSFMPCASFSGRKKLKSYCPQCKHAMAGASIKALTIQIVGGNSSGKTSYIAAFQHQYIQSIKNSNVCDVFASPADEFRELEKIYSTGRTVSSPVDKVHAYYIVHSTPGSTDDGIVIYDVPDEIILSEQYDRSPLNFAYCDGIVFMIDPLSMASVRKECEKTLGASSTRGYSDDPAEDIIVHFINKYSEVIGRKAKKMSRTPVAVVITKTDLTPVKRSIGMVRIKNEFASNRSRYRSLEECRNDICRQYLYDIGMGNAVNNIDSVFSRVSFFPVSSIGSCEDGSSFDPQNVIAPIGWIARKSRSDMRILTDFVEEDVK
ncbi:hypothetical protein SAMN02910456_01225 [Ruminococcaceae bacterium YRB3002]|nr:hypothetical protein SAMN02910456_01225 [Ruminococcaceae bacterium YRB3002]